MKCLRGSGVAEACSSGSLTDEESALGGESSDVDEEEDEEEDEDSSESDGE